MLNGCARNAPLSDDPAIATREATNMVPKGTGEAHAKKILVTRGFKVSRLSADDPRNHMLVAYYSNEKTVWLVGLVVVDGHVAASSVTISAAGEAEYPHSQTKPE